MNYSSTMTILQYIILATVSYLLLRYTPFIQMDGKQACYITIIIIMAYALYSLLYNNQPQQNVKEYFGVSQEEKPCTTCNTPETSGNKKCRLVCDDEENKKEDMTPLPKPTVNTPNTLATPSSNDTFGGMFYDEHPYYNRYNDGYNTRSNYDTDAILREYETSGFKTPYQTSGAKSEYNKDDGDNSRQIKGELDNDMPYSDYNHLPVAAGYKSKDYEYGYSFIPPEKWYPQPVRPPICVTDNRAPVCPSLASGTPVDVKDFNLASRVTGPAKINTDYIRDKLNSGR